MRPFEITGPNRAGETVRRRIRSIDCFPVRVVALDRHHRTEDLFLIRSTVLIEPHEDGGLEKETVLHPVGKMRRSATPAGKRAAFGLGPLDRGFHLVAMIRGDQWSHVGLGIEWITDLEPGHRIEKPGNESFHPITVHKNARSAGADLALILKTRSHDGWHRGFEIRVLANHDRVFATEFEGGPFEHRSRRRGDPGPGRSASSERDGRDVGMFHQTLADHVAPTMNDVEYARRKTRLDREL